MKLNSKRDVKRVGSSAAKEKTRIFLFQNLFSFFLKFSSPKSEKIHTRHQISKKDFKVGNAESQKSKNFGITPYKKEKNPKHSEVKGIFISIFIVSVILTGSTIFYFHQVSSKLVQKKESIVNLYQKYRSIYLLNHQTQLFLKTVKTYGNFPGELYMLVDEDQTIAKEEQEAIHRYYGSSSPDKKISALQPQKNIISWPLLSALGVLLVCFFSRIFLLQKEKTKLLVQEEISSETTGFFKIQAII